VIVGSDVPDFRTVSDFRKIHLTALSGLFLQVLGLCREAGLVKLGHVALDGTKVKANASRHKAMSYGRMKDDEKRLAAEIEALLRRAEEIDAKEDAEYGRDKRGDELPAELQRREDRVRRIREVKAELEKEAAEARAATLRANARELRQIVADPATAPKSRKAAATLAAKSVQRANELAPRDDDDDDDSGAGGAQLSLHRVPATPDGKPKGNAQRNFADGDSRIMPRNGAFMQAYNAQAVVSEDQIIVAHGITNNGADATHLAPMLERVRENCGQMPAIFTADNGYLSEANVAYCEQSGIDAYIALRKKDAKSTDFPPATSAAHMRFAMQLKLNTPAGRAIYARRKVLTEPVFGQIKGAMGFRRFSLRGLLKVPSEWGIVVTCHNLLKLFRREAARQLAMATT